MANLLFIIPLIIFPFLVFYISTNQFYRKANSRAIEKKPPTIPYFIPGVFHAFSLAYEGPQKYFATLLAQYGNSFPFVVKVGLQSFVILRNPSHVKEVLSASKRFSRPENNAHTYERLFGTPKEVLEMYDDVNDNKNVVEYARHILPQKHLEDPSFVSLVDIYVSTLSRNMHEKMFQFGTWTLVEDFWSFSQQVLTRCSNEMLLGSSIFKQYPSLIKDYWKFDNAIEGFIPGLPRSILPAAYEGSRDQVLHGLENWLKANHSGSEFAKISDDDPTWDEHMGSKLIQERDNVFSRVENFNWRARSAEVLSIVQRLNSSVIPASSWIIIEILRKPSLVKHVSAEIKQHYSQHSGEYDIVNIAKIPLIQSVFTEVRRCRTAAIRTLRIEGDAYKLNDEWMLSSGMNVIFFSQDISMNTQFWSKARPRAVERPLKEFWAERFLVPDQTLANKKKERPTKDQVEPGRFSMEGLEPIELLFDNSNVGLGREFLEALQVATLSVFLTEFELQLCDPEAVDAAIPPFQDIAYGTVKPLNKVAMRIRKRRGGSQL